MFGLSNHKLKTGLTFVTTLTLLHCGQGDEGVMEGYINGTPFRMEVDNVVAIGSVNFYSTQDTYDPYNYYSITTNPMTVVLGYNEGESTQYQNTLTIYVTDMKQALKGFAYPVPSANVVATLEYLYNGTTYLTEASGVGGYITFSENGYFDGQTVSADFLLVFPEGSLSGSFNTDVGLAAR